MKKLILLLCFAACSCSSGSKHFGYTAAGTPMPKEFKVSVKKVNINLSEQRNFAKAKPSDQKYPDSSEVEIIVKEEMEKQLRKYGIFAESKIGLNVFEAEIDLNYVRTFMDFTSDKYHHSELRGYKIRVYKNGELAASRSDNTTYVTQGGPLKIFSTFAMIFKQILLLANRDDEKKEIETFARSFASDLKHLGN